MIGIGIGLRRQRFAGGFADSYSARVLADGGTIESLSCIANASTLLQQASLLFIPSGYKAGVAYSALPNNGNGDLTWSRNSTANRTLANGNIGSVGANVPRLSYMYGSCPSALLEPQRTNLALYSEQFDNAYWTKSLGNISANQTIAPDGTTTADLFTKTSGVNTVAQVGSPATIFQATGVHTLSVYIKPNVGNTVLLRLDNAGNAANFGFNFTTKTFSNSGANVVSSSYDELSNGWFRLKVTGNVTSTSWNLSVCNLFSNPTNDSMYIWGAQLEVGAYATTYIPTTTATATRIADTFTRNNIYTNGLISASGGTWFIELKNNISYTRDAGSEGLFIADTSVGTTNCLQIICPLGSGRLRINKRIATIGTSLYNTTTDNVKIAIKWNGTTADVFVNGVKVVTSSAFTATQLEFLNHATTGDVPKFIQAMALFNTPLSDSDCITLTT